MTISELNQWESSIHFRSLRTATKDSLDMHNMVEDLNFATVLNRYGEVQIIDSIYVIQSGYTYSVGINSHEKLEKLRRGEKPSNVHRIKINKNSLSPSIIPTISTRKAGLSTEVISWTGDKNIYSEIFNNCTLDGRDERVLIQGFCNNYGVYSVFGIKLMGQAYRGGGLFNIKKWRDDEMYFAQIKDGYAKWKQSAVGDVMNNLRTYERNFGPLENSGAYELRITLAEQYLFRSPIYAEKIAASVSYQKGVGCVRVTRFVVFE